MGYVQRNTAVRTCRSDTLAQVRDPHRVTQLAAQGLIVKRQGIGILVFLQSDFEEFYVKHVLRKLARPDPVLVKNLAEIPTSAETRFLVEVALRKCQPGAVGGALEAEVPQPKDWRADVRIWDPLKKAFLDEMPIAKQVFRFRDVLMPTSQRSLNEALRDPAGKLLLPKNEAESLLSIYEESFQKVPVRDKKGELVYVPKTEYTIDYIWIVQKIMLYRFDWHGA